MAYGFEKFLASVIGPNILTPFGPRFSQLLKTGGGGEAKWPIAITPVFQVR